MLYRKEGYPEEDELVLCTVTNVQYNSVFCKLDEYNETGMIHISEVSPGRIRNIRDYVQEGKKVVCKVLRINKERGHIDLSLRRVSENLRRQKNNDIKQELKAEKLIEQYVKNEVKKPLEEVYKAIAKPILKKYEYVHQAFQDVVDEGLDLKKLGVPKELAERLTEIIKEKIPPKQVSIKGVFKITTYNGEGIDLIKKALKKAENYGPVHYLGNGAYRFVVTADDYENAEQKIDEAVAQVKAMMNDGISTVDFRRE